ncbi:rhamnan synthesis F family protein [Candidatus Uabimicrobium sp. HlEnr_7]|uniref:rhamnan synthesis F family protein n=1 Tax=Candidatus Uabimicrobium helgolandensis TaxID=3095367 RepID=UPI00355606DF
MRKIILVFIGQEVSSEMNILLEKVRKKHIVIIFYYKKWCWWQMQVAKIFFMSGCIKGMITDHNNFLSIMKFAKRCYQVCIISGVFRTPQMKTSMMYEFIGLCDYVIVNDKSWVDSLDISSKRFVCRTDITNIDIEPILDQKISIDRNIIKKIAQYFKISKKRAFRYHYFWWKQHYKPCNGGNYFLLLDSCSRKISIDHNPLHKIMKNITLPYKVNYISKKKICRTEHSIAIHIHMYYPEFSNELCNYLNDLDYPLDIFISTTTEKNITTIGSIFEKYSKGSVDIECVPNQGRNISAFLLMEKRYKNYDYIGHVHTKKSQDLTTQSSDAWRNFLFQHLLSKDAFAFTLSLFADNEKLGLLFPEDPRLPGWSSLANKNLALELLKKIDHHLTLPQHIEFPIGAMFWARRKALEPLFDLKLQPQDFPEEPLGIDGTLAHAIERLFPYLCEISGFTWETLKIPSLDMPKLHRKK